MRQLRHLALLLLLLSSCALADLQVLNGRFVDLQFGDYAHLQVRDERGEIHSFWLGNDRSLVKFVENPERYKGCPVKVHWHKVTRHIPEAGGDMELDEAVRIEVLE